MNCLGIGFGTTSVKAALFDETLREIASFSEAYTVKTSGNIVEFAPEKYWKLLQNALSSVQKDAKVNCLAIDTQCETLIISGNVWTRCALWAAP